MAHLREGSIGDIRYLDASASSFLATGVVITNITDQYIEFEETDGTVRVTPWAAVRFVVITTD